MKLLVRCLMLSAIGFGYFNAVEAASDIEVRVGVHGGQTRHRTTMQGEIFQGMSTKARRGLVLGGYAEVRAFQFFGAEFGIDLQDRSYSIINPTEGNQDLHYMAFVSHFLLRFGLPFLSIGIGPYWSISTGTVESVQGGVSRTLTMSGAGLRYGDFGLLGSARASIPIISRFAITGEGRLFHGTTDLTQNKSTVSKTREWQALIGIQLRF